MAEAHVPDRAETRMPAPSLSVLHVIESPSWTGAMAQTFALCAGLVRRGHRVTLATTPGSILEARAREAGLDVVTLNLNSELNPVTIARLVGLVVARSVDVVHAHRAHAHSLALIAAALTGRPFVVSRRVSFRPKDNAGSRLKYRSRAVSRVVAVSQAVRDVLVRYGVPSERVVVVYSGSDPSVYRAGLDGSRVRREFGIPDDAPLVGKVANFYRRWKGHDTFLAAAARVRAASPGARFLLAGHLTDGESMRGMVDAAGLAGSVALAGYRPDVPEVLAALSVSVNCPKAGEGLSGAVRESLAAGVPVVATDVGGNRELVLDGRTGLLVPPDDPDALAAAILRLLGDRAFAAGLAAAGARFVRERLTEDRMVEETERVYRDVLRERGRG